jgi:hypothetical protein
MAELMSVVLSNEAPLQSADWDGVPLWSSSAYVDLLPSQSGVYVLYEGENALPQAYYDWEMPAVANSRCVR